MASGMAVFCCCHCYAFLFASVILWAYAREPSSVARGFWPEEELPSDGCSLSTGHFAVVDSTHASGNPKVLRPTAVDSTTTACRACALVPVYDLSTPLLCLPELGQKRDRHPTPQQTLKKNKSIFFFHLSRREEYPR
uniref:Secreted protein n=1 Tax=Rhodosorus marinus TaxID=101924 RepID=A0A7S2ZFL6_9RHOD